MREHGILNRVLLIYDEALRRMEKGTDIPAEVISGSAGIIRRFIENYLCSKRSRRRQVYLVRPGG